MKRSLLAIAAASALALVLAGGTFFALKFTASGATHGVPWNMVTIPGTGNPDSHVAGWTYVATCNGTTVPCPAPLTLGKASVFDTDSDTVVDELPGITPWDYPAMNPPGFVAISYFSELNCLPASAAAVIVEDPLNPLAANDLRVKNGSAPPEKVCLETNCTDGPAAVDTAENIALGQCNDGLDNDTDTVVDDGCVIPPWDRCDNDADTYINDGCAAVDTAESGAMCSQLSNGDDDSDTVVNDGCPAKGPGKSGILITPGNTPYTLGVGPILSAGIVVVAGEYQCGDNKDSDGDTLINDGCKTVGTAETVCNETEAACADVDGERPWDACDNDNDGGINDGCVKSGTEEAVVIPDPLNYQYLACGNADGTTPVTGWNNKLDANFKLIGPNAQIDADAWNGAGPCKIMDASSTVYIGDTNDVAVCLGDFPAPTTGPSNGVSKFQFDLTYHPAMNECPESNCDFPNNKCLDDNPDANEGSTLGQGSPTVPDLGGGWDCSVIGKAQPLCGGTPERETDCENATDDDGDTVVNDGCPALGAAETGTQCADAVDANEDGGPDAVNDGCPVAAVTVATASETACTGAVDDDYDGFINDGCPTVGTNPETGAYCADAVDAYEDGAPDAVNDGCPAVAKAFIACASTTGPFPLTGIGIDFPIFTVSLKALAVGVDNLTLQNSATYDKGGIALGSCNPVLFQEPALTCVGALISKEEPPPATPTPTNTPLPPTATPTPTKTPSALGEGVFMWKDANVLTDPAEDPANVETVNNLWLMDPALGCPDAASGKGCLLVNKWVFQACDGISPNTGDIEGVGAWEEQIKYDHKIVRLTPVPNNTWLSNNGARWVSCSMTILTENWILTGCVTADFDSADPKKGPGTVCDGSANGLIETIKVVPMTDDLMYRQGFRPGKDNGVVTDLVDENCELSNTLGEKLPAELPGGLTTECGDVHITVRMLEGDIDLDCNVDVVDEQGIAFRYGTFFGLTLYDEWYDLAPECQDYACDKNADTIYDDTCRVCYGVPDFDIDIKDLQFVFGRDGSTCVDPIPDDQGPVDPAQP